MSCWRREDNDQSCTLLLQAGEHKNHRRGDSEGAGVKAVSVTDEPELSQRVDVLYLGGAPYANIMAPELKAYAEKLESSKVGKVVLFTTSNWSRRTVLALKKMLKAKNIRVSDEYFYAHMLHIKGRVDAAREFGRKE